jgi:hypothetical protein
MIQMVGAQYIVPLFGFSFTEQKNLRVGSYDPNNRNSLLSNPLCNGGYAHHLEFLFAFLFTSGHAFQPCRTPQRKPASAVEGNFPRIPDTTKQKKSARISLGALFNIPTT